MAPGVAWIAQTRAPVYLGLGLDGAHPVAQPGNAAPAGADGCFRMPEPDHPRVDPKVFHNSRTAFQQPSFPGTVRLFAALCRS